VDRRTDSPATVACLAKKGQAVAIIFFIFDGQKKIDGFLQKKLAKPSMPLL
jgi:hypothetical protein